MRAFGLDLGEKRIGVAISDPGLQIATPYEVILRSGQKQNDHKKIFAMAQEADVDCLVIGIPRSLDGSFGPSAIKIVDEIARIKENIPLTIHQFDERFSTVEARKSLETQGISAKAQRKIIDMVAACVILQSWLDSRSNN